MATDRINMLDDNDTKVLQYGNSSVSFRNTSSVLARNKIFSRNEIQLHDRYSRFGYLNPYDDETVLREFLFFTKPDLNIFDTGDKQPAKNRIYYETFQTAQALLHPDLKAIPFFYDLRERNIRALTNLQVSIRDPEGIANPFINILTNCCTSKLDFPDSSADSNESTSTIYGANISYRSHSLKSDLGYDFTLSFTDTPNLSIYYMVKAYDEYMKLVKLGATAPKQNYIVNMVDPSQFSVYKFLIGSDGETILWYGKATGVQFMNVPRSDMSDPTEGFKFSLSFHAQFVEDNNPAILSEFNKISPTDRNGPIFKDDATVINGEVNNKWVRFPIIKKISDRRTDRRGVKYDYRLLWQS